MLTSKVGKIGKVVICGMKGVGKTAILEQLIYGSINPDSVSKSVPLFRLHYLTVFLIQELCSTIEDTYVASVDTGRGPRDTLRIFDTAGLQGNVQVSSDFCWHFRTYNTEIHFHSFPDIICNSPMDMYLCMIHVMLPGIFN